MGTPAKINFDGTELRLSRDGYCAGISEKLYNALNDVFEIEINQDGAFKGFVTIYKASMLNAFISANRFEVKFADDVGYDYEYFINSKELTIKAMQDNEVIFNGAMSDFIVAHSSLLEEPELYFSDERINCNCKQKELFNKNSYKAVLKAHKKGASYFKDENPNKGAELKSAAVMEQVQNLFKKEAQIV